MSISFNVSPNNCLYFKLQEIIIIIASGRISISTELFFFFILIMICNYSWHLGLLKTNRRKKEMLSLPGYQREYIFIITSNLINVFLMPSGQIILKVNRRDWHFTNKSENV